MPGGQSSEGAAARILTAALIREASLRLIAGVTKATAGLAGTLALLPAEGAVPASVLLQALLQYLLTLVGKLALRLKRMLDKVAHFTLLRVLQVGLAILGALERVIEDRDDVVGFVARTGLLLSVCLVLHDLRPPNSGICGPAGIACSPPLNA